MCVERLEAGGVGGDGAETDVSIRPHQHRAPGANTGALGNPVARTTSTSPPQRRLSARGHPRQRCRSGVGGGRPGELVRSGWRSPGPGRGWLPLPTEALPDERAPCIGDVELLATARVSVPHQGRVEARPTPVRAASTAARTIPSIRPDTSSTWWSAASRSISKLSSSGAGHARARRARASTRCPGHRADRRSGPRRRTGSTGARHRRAGTDGPGPGAEPRAGACGTSVAHPTSSTATSAAMRRPIPAATTSAGFVRARWANSSSSRIADEREPALVGQRREQDETVGRGHHVRGIVGQPAAHADVGRQTVPG